MADIDWPTGLPPRPMQQGFDEELGSGTDRSNIEAGNPQRRNRSNAVPDQIGCSLLMDADQAALLDTFFCVTTRGCLRFNWQDSLGNAAECRFVSAPKLTLAEAGIFKADFKFEVFR